MTLLRSALLAALAMGLAGTARATSLKVCKASTGLNFRSGPSINAHIDTVLSDGHEVTTLGKTSGMWDLVRDPSSHKTGWLYREWLCHATDTPDKKDKKDGARSDHDTRHRSGGAPAVTAHAPAPRYRAPSSPPTYSYASYTYPAAAASYAAASPGLGTMSAGMSGGTCGLSSTIMSAAYSVADQIDTTGGYRFDGYNDCYGFDRRVWGSVGVGLPTNDYPSGYWAPITDWSQLQPGDVLATAQGHEWGGNWHGGLFAGMDGNTPIIFDDSPGNANGGAMPHSLPSWGYFGFYYVPTHDALLASSCSGSQYASIQP